MWHALGLQLEPAFRVSVTWRNSFLSYWVGREAPLMTSTIYSRSLRFLEKVNIETDIRDEGQANLCAACHTDKLQLQ